MLKISRQALLRNLNILAVVNMPVGINAVFEMLVSTVVSGMLAKALEKARLIGR